MFTSFAHIPTTPIFGTDARLLPWRSGTRVILKFYQKPEMTAFELQSKTFIS